MADDPVHSDSRKPIEITSGRPRVRISLIVGRTTSSTTEGVNRSSAVFSRLWRTLSTASAPTASPT